MQLSLPFNIKVQLGKNGKYVKKEDCIVTHKDSIEHLDRKLSELTLDRNQKLLELKADLIDYMNIKFDILRR